MRRRGAILLALLGLYVPLPADADSVTLCYNYGCRSQVEVRFSEAQQRDALRLFETVRSPAEERRAVAQALGWLYFHAATQSPLWRDQGGNYADGEVDGRMDCIDHAHNADVQLRLLEARGALRYHRVGDPVRRGFLLNHWAARLVELSGDREWVVDTWFRAPGEPAVLFELQTWRRGARPRPGELVREPAELLRDIEKDRGLE